MTYEDPYTQLADSVQAVEELTDRFWQEKLSQLSEEIITFLNQCFKTKNSNGLLDGKRLFFKQCEVEQSRYLVEVVRQTVTLVKLHIFFGTYEFVQDTQAALRRSHHDDVAVLYDKGKKQLLLKVSTGLQNDVEKQFITIYPVMHLKRAQIKFFIADVEFVIKCLTAVDASTDQ